MSGAPRLLHLCSDFAKQRIYRELVAALDATGVGQHVYVPVRSAGEMGVNKLENLPRTTFRYAHILRPRHRLLFRTKIRRIVRDVLAGIDPSSFDVAHAHFLYSDGAAALALRKKHGLRYLVAVRNTDVNVFMRYRPDLRWVCWDVIAHAENLVFITPAYLDLLLRRVPASLRASVADKARVIPNGVSSFWLERAEEPPARQQGGAIRLLYVGELAKNKNIEGILKAAALLNERRPVTVTLVGAGGDAEEAVESLLRSPGYGFAKRLGRVDDSERLAAIYRAHDVFVMPSFRETFGVAYVEALSQGLPIVFSRGQGVDGYFEANTVGEAVDPGDVHGIASAVLALAERRDAVRARCVSEARSFAWPGIARKYLDLYRAIAAKTDDARHR